MFFCKDQFQKFQNKFVSAIEIICFSKSTRISVAGFLWIVSIKIVKKLGDTCKGNKPLFKAFPLKISAKKLETITLNP